MSLHPPVDASNVALFQRCAKNKEEPIGHCAFVRNRTGPEKVLDTCIQEYLEPQISNFNEIKMGLCKRFLIMFLQYPPMKLTLLKQSFKSGQESIKGRFCACGLTEKPPP